ncbi:hypothetical protein RB195_021556 [Necator americanus]|uniref:Uncharacterized protein n=1 Tax=Necator americanus TaxID=51031 RepID=A0ABR1ECA7_NECAM
MEILWIGIMISCPHESVILSSIHIERMIFVIYRIPDEGRDFSISAPIPPSSPELSITVSLKQARISNAVGGSFLSTIHIGWWTCSSLGADDSCWLSKALKCSLQSGAVATPPAILLAVLRLDEHSTLCHYALLVEHKDFSGPCLPCLFKLLS